MKLFSKIFIAVFVSFILLLSALSYVMAAKQISDMKDRILEENSFVVGFVSQEVERGYLESRWPFDSLSKLSERDGFLFWWVIRDDGTIYMAHEASFMGTNAYDYFPQVADMTGDRNVLVDQNENYGILTAPLEMGRDRWSFWYGFSMTAISRMRHEIISMYTVVSVLTLTILGIILYLIARRFTGPVGDLAAGAEAIGKGDLSHRVKAGANDELGQLASSFNKMARDLQVTTVSKDYVDSIINSMLDALIVVDPAGKIQTVNKATCELLGYEEKELTGKPVEAVLDVGGETPIDIMEPSKLTEDGLQSYETNFKTKGGNRVPILLSNSVMKGKEGNMTRIVYTGKDITQLKRAEEKLKDSEERFRIASQISSDVVYERDLQTGVATFYGDIDTHLGYDLGGYPRTWEGWREHVHPEDLAWIESKPIDQLEPGVPYSIEYRMRKKDGTYMDWLDRVMMIWDEKTGRPLKFIGAATNITERKRADEHIRVSLREKEVLLKEIHHRVKNNLQVISSLIYLQSKNVKDVATVEMLEDSRNRIRSMSLIHERLYQSQDLARVEFGEYVRNLANYLLRSYGSSANGIRLTTNVDDVFLGVDTAIPCGLIVNELVSNSLKHAFPDGRQGEIRIELRGDDGDKLTLIVNDDGVGFPQDVDYRKTKSLGLQLVNTLVTQLEGTIELDRSGGTVFKITFSKP